ncbi:MAG: hypothetical protein WC553_02640 [Patescibacteria group bacterium]|jgi:hypothetical protein
MAARTQLKRGPSVGDMMLALFAPCGQYARPVNFYGDDGQHFIVEILGMAKEDGSGNNWLFKGMAGPADQTREDCHGYFNTQHRTGWIELGSFGNGN